MNLLAWSTFCPELRLLALSSPLNMHMDEPHPPLLKPSLASTRPAVEGELTLPPSVCEFPSLDCDLTLLHPLPKVMMSSKDCTAQEKKPRKVESKCGSVEVSPSVGETALVPGEEGAVGICYGGTYFLVCAWLLLWVSAFKR
jgi:hypothetical protein